MESIFKDERFLYIDYLPERLPHRDNEINSIADAFKPAAKGKKPTNLIIMGPSGIGKTACIKFVVREFSSTFQRILPIYINCFENSTRLGILTFINSKFQNPLPRRGISIDEAYTELKEVFSKSDKVPIIIFDEADQLIYKNSTNILYDIVRLQDAVGKILGITLITNNPTFDLYLEPRIISSLAAEYLHFEPYNPQQLKDILRQRAEKAFLKGYVQKEAIALVAAYAAKHKGDCRLALEALLKAGRIADRKGEKLSVKHVKEALSKMEKNPARKYLFGLEENEKILLYILAKNNGCLNSGKLYEEFHKLSSLGERRIRMLLQRLEKLKLVSLEEKVGRGKTRIIKLQLDKELIIQSFKSSI